MDLAVPARGGKEKVKEIVLKKGNKIMKNAIFCLSEQLAVFVESNIR